jgi:hypothetical protein
LITGGEREMKNGGFARSPHGVPSYDMLQAQLSCQILKFAKLVDYIW